MQYMVNHIYPQVSRFNLKISYINYLSIKTESHEQISV